MKYFRRMKSTIDPKPFLDEIAAIEDAWALSTGRQEKIHVQREALSIPLRGLRKSAIRGRARRDVHESRWTNGSGRFPLARRFIEDFAEEQGSLLGRAKIVCLPAGRRVYPHVDRGAYYRIRNRFHLVLRSARGSWLKAGDEEVRMQEGELWWFDNNQLHEAFNDGDQDRIHMIFDLLPGQGRTPGAGDRRAHGERSPSPQAEQVARSQQRSGKTKVLQALSASPSGAVNAPFMRLCRAFHPGDKPTSANSFTLPFTLSIARWAR